MKPIIKSRPLNHETLKIDYYMGRCSLGILRMAVIKGFITAEEYKDITGINFNKDVLFTF
nr:MAG TPA: hypothetical protein [Caudoviricetes sp.]